MRKKCVKTTIDITQGNQYRGLIANRVPLEFESVSILLCGRGSVAGLAIGYGLDGPAIESRGGGEIFRTCPDRPWGPPSLPNNGYRVFPGVKSGRSVTLTPRPLLVPWSLKGRAISLLPLCAVRPVQCLSPGTRVTFTFTFTLHRLCCKM